MRHHVPRLAVALLALVFGAIGPAGIARPAAANAAVPPANVVAQAAPHGKHVRIFDFSRVAAPAPAGVTPAAATATTCYGGAIWQYTSVSPTTFPSDTTSFTATSRCLDINMRKSTDVPWNVSACVIFVDHTTSCNYWTTISTSWKTIATNVADTTHFRVLVQFDWWDACCTTAIQLAF
jgi:hypothetical protein